MKATAVQVSSLVKTRPEEICTSREITSKKLMKGEVFSYQITLWTDRKADFEVTFESPIKEFIKLYTVKNSYVDFPTYDWGCDDYITKTPFPPTGMAFFAIIGRNGQRKLQKLPFRAKHLPVA